MSTEGRTITVSDALNVLGKKIPEKRQIIDVGAFKRVVSEGGDNPIMELKNKVAVLHGICGRCIHIDPHIQHITRGNNSVEIHCNAGRDPILLYSGHFSWDPDPTCPKFEPK